MASLNGLFSDPKKLTAVSDFLLGFSQGTQKANVPGASPFGAIGAGFATGGQNVKHAASQRAQAAQQREEQRMAMLQKQQDFLRGQAEIRKIESESKAEEVFRERFSKLDPNDREAQFQLALLSQNAPTAKAMLSSLKPSAPGKPVQVIGEDGNPVYVSPQDAVGRTPADSGGGGPIDGKGVAASAWNGIAALRDKQARGETLTEEDISNGRIYAAIIESEGVRTDANGNLIKVKTNMPPDLAALLNQPTAQAATSQEVQPQAVPGQVAPATEQAPTDVVQQQSPTGGLEITKLQDKLEEDDYKPRLEAAMSLVEEIVSDLNSGPYGETTGMKGAFNARFGGLMRQAGIPAGTEAAQLSQKLKTMSLMMAPLLTGEKRLSNEERANVSRIIGSINVMNDEADLRNSLMFLVDMLEKMDSFKGKIPVGGEANGQ